MATNKKNEWQRILKIIFIRWHSWLYLSRFAGYIMEPIITLKDINIVYNLGKSNEYHANKNVNVEIYPQEYIIFFGPSGCGKSTLLYCLLGALPPSSGELIVKGINPYAATAKELVDYQRKTIGIIYQSFNLLPSLTVLDNVGLPQIFAEVSPGEREERGMALLRRFGIEIQAHKRPLSLSGGQQQRVAVARSLINDPEILLADEPVGNLDSISRAQVMNTLLEINSKDKKTVILVTHDARHLPYAHRVYYIKDGKVEREVVNPERPQIKQVQPGQMVITEIEKLARIYPYLTPEELKVKSIVNYLIEDLSFEQIERLENAVKEFIQGKMDAEGFRKILTVNFESGGIGLSIKVAEKMSDKIEHVMKESKNISRYRRHIEDDYYPKQKALIRDIRIALLDEYDKDINFTQLRRLNEIIVARVAGTIQKEEFQRNLYLSLEKGGIGFSRPAAKKISRHLEKLVVQGVHA